MEFGGGVRAVDVGSMLSSVSMEEKGVRKVLGFVWNDLTEILNEGTAVRNVTTGEIMV